MGRGYNQWPIVSATVMPAPDGRCRVLTYPYGNPSYAYTAIQTFRSRAFSCPANSKYQGSGECSCNAPHYKQQSQDASAPICAPVIEENTASLSQAPGAQVVSTTSTIGAKTFTTQYGWGDSGSALDKITSITYPSGTRVNFTYNLYGTVNGITVNPPNANGAGLNEAATTLLTGVAYNIDGNPKAWQWSDGKPRAIAYDNQGLAVGYTLGDPQGSGVTRTLSRDAGGRIKAYTHSNSAGPQPALDQSFGYDKLNRLIAATLNGAGTLYTYDAKWTHCNAVAAAVHSNGAQSI